jgi:hypothetical protein
VSKALEENIINEEEKTSQSSRSPTVRFSQLEIRLYKVIPETNPSVSIGPAIGLDWTYEAIPAMPLDVYEESRPPRLDLDDVQLSLNERMKILREAGSTNEEIEEAIRKSDQAREERYMTLRNMRNEDCDIRRESLIRGVKKAFHIQKSDAAEQKMLWKKAQVVV